MRRGFQRPLGTTIALMLFVGACGANNNDGNAAGSSHGLASRYPKIAASVPGDIKKRGFLRVAMSADYPPDHFTQNGKLVGFDPDFSKALEGVLGIKLNLIGTSFEAIIPGLQSRRYDIAVATVFITPEREKVVDYVRYFDSGSSIVVRSGNKFGIKSIADLCGRRGAIEKGTAAVNDMAVQSKKCVAAGKPAVKVSVYEKQTEANLALLSDQADFLDFNSDATGYAAKQNSQFQVIAQYATFPTGIILPKGQRPLAESLRAAVQALIDDGTYNKILTKWGMQSGGVKKSEIVPPAGG